jgi:hypothetical protein
VGGFSDRRIAYISKGVAGQLYVNTNSETRHTVFVAGSGRGGTTWLAEMINHRNEYRYIFEPFHPVRVPICKDFRSRQYLPPDNRDPQYMEPARRILSGQVRGLWTDRFNRKRLASRRLVKEVRGNLLLGWMDRNFPEIPLILIMRHPCAVVHSQLAREWNWRVDLSELLSQKSLMEDFLAPFRDIIDAASSRFERQVLLWCIENYVPTQQFRRDQIHVTFYEHLCLDPAFEMKRVLSFLGKEFDESIMVKVRRPSALTRNDSAIVSGNGLIDRWRTGITNDEMKKAIELLSVFGLDRIYSEGSLPLLEDGADALATV